MSFTESYTHTVQEEAVIQGNPFLLQQICFILSKLQQPFLPWLSNLFHRPHGHSVLFRPHSPSPLGSQA